MTDRRHIWRTVLVVLVLVAAWVALGVRLTMLHLGSNERLHQRIDKIRKVEKEIMVGRGRILDCRGNDLAMDVSKKDVYVDAERILKNGDARAVAFQLARGLQMDPKVVFDRIAIHRVIKTGRNCVLIKPSVAEEDALRIQRLQLDGVFFKDVYTRLYPKNEMFCHVVGFVNMEGVGSAGMEQVMDESLRGRPGLLISEKDGKQIEVVTRRTLDISPQPGVDVYLTLDQNLQYIVEKALDAAIVEHKAVGAWAIMERVRTGEILAMASRPAFDPNNYRGATEAEMRDRAIGYVYEPGSTFKVAVIASALNEGTVTPDQIFDCESGAWVYQGRTLRDYHPNAMLSVADIIKKSSNIGAAKVAVTLGKERLYTYLKAFGFGQPTGIALPGEEGGILHDVKNWYPISITRIPMGQGIGVTAMQMLNMLCCIANNGYLMRPAIVRRIVDAKGLTIQEFVPEVMAKPIREDTARLMQKLLARVTEEGGTGTKARVDGYTVAGKTGTAQKPVNGHYSDSANIASFMGFLPAENPELAIMIVIDEPQPLHTGGQVAAPIFQEIASQAVRYLDVPSAAEVERTAWKQPENTLSHL